MSRRASAPDVMQYAAIVMRGCSPDLWRIRSTRETCQDSGKPLYWSNADGWVDRESADKFDEGDRMMLCLPMGAKWEGASK
jgi:hypothetical protein